MNNQNELEPIEEGMLDVFEVEELESRLEMCGDGWYENPCTMKVATGAHR